MIESSNNQLQSEKIEKYIKNFMPILNLMPEAIFIFLSSDYEIKWINHFSLENIYLSNYFFLGRNLFDSQTTEKPFEEMIKNLKRLDTIHFQSIEFNTIFEHQAIIRWRACFLPDHLDKKIGFFLVGNHSSKNQFFDKKLNYLENFWETIIDSVAGSIYWKNKKGYYLGCNEAMVRKANLKTKEDIIGKRDDELWPQYAPDICQRDNEVIRTNKTLEFQEIVKIHTGEKLYLASVKTPLKNEFGEPIGIIGNSLDITDVIQSRYKIEKINNSKTEFILNMQHDIKTPIGHIIGLSDILLGMNDFTEENKKYINYIKTSAQRLMEMMVDVLYFLDVESESMAKTEEIFNLREMIQKITELYVIPINQKKLELKVDYEQSVPENFSGDKVRVHRIILNLFDNAIKFTERGSIAISVKLKKQIDNAGIVLLELSVEDTGLGIPEEKYDEIFEKFSRLSPSGRNLYKGLGLGLWIVKEFIRDLGGKIDVSSCLGYGTRFISVFPLKMPL